MKTTADVGRKAVAGSARVLLNAVIAGAVVIGGHPAHAQIIETSKDRVVTNLSVGLPYIGTVAARGTREIESSNWLLGCETLDRDFADYDQYKAFIAPLGIKRLRMQAGWSKTETVKGRYDFAWLDHIIDDATRSRCCARRSRSTRRRSSCARARTARRRPVAAGEGRCGTTPGPS